MRPHGALHEVFRVVAANSQPVIYKFCDETLSDVTFKVMGDLFKCHKMMLAIRSSYFKEMFITNLHEKTEEPIAIDADPVIFKYLMDILYGESWISWKDVINCENRHENSHPCRTCRGRSLDDRGNHQHCLSPSNLWVRATSVLKLAAKLDVYDYTLEVLKTYLLLGDKCQCEEDDCARQGVKLIIAMEYRMDEVGMKSTASKKALLRGMDAVRNVQDIFTLDINILRTLMLDDD